MCIRDRFQGNTQRLALALDQVDLTLAREEINFAALPQETEFKGRPYVIVRKNRSQTDHRSQAPTYRTGEYARTF